VVGRKNEKENEAPALRNAGETSYGQVRHVLGQGAEKYGEGKSQKKRSKKQDAFGSVQPESSQGHLTPYGKRKPRPEKNSRVARQRNAPGKASGTEGRKKKRKRGNGDEGPTVRGWNIPNAL